MTKDTATELWRCARWAPSGGNVFIANVKVGKMLRVLLLIRRKDERYSSRIAPCSTV